MQDSGQGDQPAGARSSPEDQRRCLRDVWVRLSTWTESAAEPHTQAPASIRRGLAPADAHDANLNLGGDENLLGARQESGVGGAACPEEQEQPLGSFVEVILGLSTCRHLSVKAGSQVRVYDPLWLPPRTTATTSAMSQSATLASVAADNGDSRSMNVVIGSLPLVRSAPPLPQAHMLLTSIPLASTVVPVL